jgi:hypothetical protein
MPPWPIQTLHNFSLSYRLIQKWLFNGYQVISESPATIL